MDGIAMCIDPKIVDGEIVHAGGENGVMPSVQDRNVAKSNVATILEANRFVADTSGEGGVSFTSAQALSPNQSRPKDRQIFDTLSPEQAIAPMAMAEVLKLVPGVWLRWIVPATAALRGRSGHNGSSGIEQQDNIALEMD